MHVFFNDLFLTICNSTLKLPIYQKFGIFFKYSSPQECLKNDPVLKRVPQTGRFQIRQSPAIKSSYLWRQKLEQIFLKHFFIDFRL